MLKHDNSDVGCSPGALRILNPKTSYSFFRSVFDAYTTSSGALVGMFERFNDELSKTNQLDQNTGIEEMTITGVDSVSCSSGSNE